MVVISSKEGVYALKEQNPQYTFNSCYSKDFKSQKEYEDALIKILASYDVELVILAGFIKVLSPHFFVKAFQEES